MPDDRNRRPGNDWQSGRHDGGPQEESGAYDDASPGTPPRYTGSVPGYGSHGMGHGPQGGTQSGAWGVYGVPRDYADHQSNALERPQRTFDIPHGRVGFGMSGSFSSGGELGSRTDSIGPAPGGGGFQRGEHNASQQQGRTAQPRGRAPKNYRRSDERIHEDVCERLMHSDRIDASDVAVEVKDGHVTLVGTVAHKQMKRWIEDLAAECAGVQDVENKLRVAFTAAWPESTASANDTRASRLHEPPT